MITSLKLTNWPTDWKTLSEIRRKVFIDEQQVPEELEIDADDFTAWHWLASVSDEPVGTVRLTQGGKIGRMAVLPSYRGLGIGRSLLDAATDFADQQEMPEVTLAAQEHAIGFYERAGFLAEGDAFMDAGIPHRTMRKVFRAQVQAPPPQEPTASADRASSEKFRVADLSASIGEFCALSKRQLRILSHSLEPDFYGAEGLAETLSQLARKHRDSEIRLLIQDDRPLREIRHPLVELSRRLSAVSIRVMPRDQALEHNECFVVSDNTGLLVYKHNIKVDAWASYNLRPVAREYSERFDRLWHFCRPSPWLRPLY